jgi:cysteinyl-tRNA synthetase
VLSFTDTLSGKKVAFAPRDPGRAGIYWCGPTVYDHPHLGHARSALGYDILHRYLEWRGYDVTLVSNITDIDDNIIKRAAREGRPEHEVAAEYEQSYIDQMDRLGIAAPDLRPRATEYVPQMIDVISLLIDRGYAYAVDGSGVYFDVDRLDDYGALVHRDVHDLREGAGARVDVDERKDDPLDFALWKSAKPGEPSWPSPWGEGRPGWHIECAAMSLDILGDDFDIHGGGDDLTFPHHTNERAEALAAGRSFARHWVHNAMINVGGEKMSKSLDNFRTVAELLAESPLNGRALRLLLSMTHYRKTMEVNAEVMKQAREGIGRLDAMARKALAAGVALDGPERDTETVAEFQAVMDHDLGTPEGVAIVFKTVRRANSALDAGDADAAALVATAVELASVLGLSFDPGGSTDPGRDAEIDSLVVARTEARESGDFAVADRIRAELTALGVVVEDTPSGPVWRRG